MRSAGANGRGGEAVGSSAARPAVFTGGAVSSAPAAPPNARMRLRANAPAPSSASSSGQVHRPIWSSSASPKVATR